MERKGFTQCLKRAWYSSNNSLISLRVNGGQGKIVHNRKGVYRSPLFNFTYKGINSFEDFKRALEIKPEFLYIKFFFFEEGLKGIQNRIILTPDFF